MTERRIDIKDGWIDAARDFSDDVATAIVAQDFGGSASVPGLKIRIGRHRVTWTYCKDDRRRGQRNITSVTLGHYPEMNTAAARAAALVEAGKVAAGAGDSGKRKATKFEAAFADYLDHLSRLAVKRGKPARWRKNVEHLGTKILLPQWEGWSLADMALNPAAVAKWHRSVTRDNGPVSANHAARVVRAAYKRAAKLDLTLPMRDPCAAVEYNDETPAQKAMPFKSFPAWLDALDQIQIGPKAPARREYHLFCLLTGMRPGEAARIRWRDVKPGERVIVIPAAKAGRDIHVIMSAAMARVLKRARVTGKPKSGDAFVFAHCGQVGAREALPYRGHALRHTWRTVAADCAVDELVAHVMLGHVPQNISQAYVTKFVLAGGPALRQAQRKVSRRMIALLGRDPTFDRFRLSIS